MIELQALLKLFSLKCYLKQLSKNKKRNFKNKVFLRKINAFYSVELVTNVPLWKRERTKSVIKMKHSIKIFASDT